MTDTHRVTRFKQMNVQMSLPFLVKRDRAIENGFPVGLVSQLAEHESWRKEVYRPLSYIHKWWAKRLGSVFRAIIIGSCLGEDQDVGEAIHQQAAFPDTVVFDPFMGSGTTIHEALKLGCKVIGRDINPVAFHMVHAALQPVTQGEARRVFEHIAQQVEARIRSLYSCRTANGVLVDVLYFFWVKVIPCPACPRQIDLFKNRVFAKHAYPKRFPAAKALCPGCSAINDVQYNDTATTCLQCGTHYNPQSGTTDGTRVTCPFCHTSFLLLEAVRKSKQPPEERLYAKMVLFPNGEKEFLAITPADVTAYQQAAAMLPAFQDHIPQVSIQPGYNTKQILNYNYQRWDQLFNARQLVALTMLSTEIAHIEQAGVRELFACLFSGILEFNTMFASFKGIGTGAVRPMFAHHILKPELTPLEANPWGTDKSSGSFSTLYESRILRALEYKTTPFEFQITRQNGKVEAEKIYGISRPIDTKIASTYQAFSAENRVYLSAGDSAQTDLPNSSVDLVITDPPFFDNVHYSELADFFYIWLMGILEPNETAKHTTTRSPREVQSGDANIFVERLTAVFRECHRVLRDDGLLVFTYHHSRNEGWVALYKALRTAGFSVTKTHPVKAEMAVSVPIQQSEYPVNFDLIIVCRKTETMPLRLSTRTLSPRACLPEAQAAIQRLQEAYLKVSLGDAKIILIGCLLPKLESRDDLTQELNILQALEKEVDALAKEALGVSYWPPTNTSKDLTADERAYLDALWTLAQKQTEGSNQPRRVHLTMRDVLYTMGRKNSNTERSKLSRCIFHAEALNILGLEKIAGEKERVGTYSPILIIEHARWEPWRGERLLLDITFHFGLNYFEQRLRGDVPASGWVSS
jgi:putative DNA methylase